jgi:DNA-binding NarL/FixJ family response regulator
MRIPSRWKPPAPRRCVAWACAGEARRRLVPRARPTDALRSPVFRVLCLPGDGNALTLRSALVGREIELARVDEFVGGVASGTPRALLIEGAPGAGKTALWSEGLARARTRGCRTLVARPVEIETALSFASLADLLEPVLDETMPSLPEPQRRALEIALLLHPTDAGPDWRALSTAVVNVLRAGSAEIPLVVALDDAQWLDSPSSAVLAFAARRLAAHRVGFMLTRRLEGGDGRLPLETALADRLDRVTPSPLSLGALNRLLQEHFGRPFSRPLVRRIRAVSAGNPFFTLELARALEQSETTGAAPHDLPLPATLHEVVRNRLAALPAAERTMLVAVAALSQPSLALAAAAVGRAAGEASLRCSLETGVVELEGNRLRFTHPLLASAAYTAVGADDRRRLHGRLAGIVSDLEESVQHLALAATGADERLAGRLEEVAAGIRARGAPDRAAEMLTRAVELTPAGDPRTHRRTLAAADCWTDAGDSARAVPLLDAALAICHGGDERAAALARLGWIRCRNAGYRGGGAYFEAAAAEGPGELSVQLSVEKGLAWTAQMLGDLPAAERHAAAAARIAAETGEPALEAQALGDLGFIEMLAGRPHFWTRLRRAQDLDLDRAQAEGDPGDAARWLDVRTRWFEAVALAWTDDLDAARLLLLGLRAEAEDLGHEHVLPDVLNWLGRVECFAGRTRAGLAYAREADDAAGQAGMPVEHPYTLATIGLALARLGEVEAAAAATSRGLAIARQLEVVPGRLELLTASGFLELSVGQFEHAHATLTTLAGEAAAAGFAFPATVRFHPDLVESCLAVGDLDGARGCASLLDACARTFATPWASAMAARCAGLVAAEEGDLESALTRIEQALAEHERLPDPFERARTELQRGIVLRRLKRRRAAREALTAARTAFEELDAPLWAERARSELARVSGGSPRANGGLTETEARVATLVAAGRANKEVAAELHVTVRTVESNLTRIYRKLGVRSRGQLAARLPTIR